MKILLRIAIVLALIAGYLLLWPTEVQPVAWTAPTAPAADGVYAYNEKLKGLQRIAPGLGNGPEAVAVDARGRVYTGYNDGRVMMFSADLSHYTQLANTGGRPLGITFGPNGGIVIADAHKGLLLNAERLTTLVTEADGQPFGFTDDVDNTVTTKDLYFSDASWKFGYGHHMEDILEHAGNGRLLVHNVESGETRKLMDGLNFANGVAVGPDDAYVLVNETAEYRVLRYWLKGDKAGTHDIFIDNLPGFPDNITFNGKDRFWVAFAAPRDALLDKLAQDVFMRKLIARLPSALQPGPKRHGYAIALDLDGKVVANLQYAGEDAFSPITSVREFGPWLFFGSLTENAIGRLPLNAAVSNAPPPMPGSEELPAISEIALPKESEREREEREAGER